MSISVKGQLRRVGKVVCDYQSPFGIDGSESQDFIRQFRDIVDGSQNVLLYVQAAYQHIVNVAV